MHINWLGYSCLKIQTAETNIILFPFSESKVGYKLNKTKADIVVGYPENIKEGFKKQKDCFVIDTQGEYEVKDAFIYVKNCNINDKNYYICRLELENISIAHLDSIPKVPQDKDLDLIENCDIVCIPVGGGEVLDVTNAINLINSIEPRIVIPICYKDKDSKLKLDSVDSFIKKFGVSHVENLDKLKISSNKLPQDKMELKVLAKS